MTPEASSDTAMGMNTISLKAVAQRIRSVSTAKIRPSTVTRLGATTTQIRLFLIVLSVPESLKMAP